jgi:fatty acid desaturase
MKIWRHSPLDACLLVSSIAHLVVTLWTAVMWSQASLVLRCAIVALLVVMMTYNIIVISHLFTHTPWFRSPLLNALASMLNSVDIGQSVQAYQLMHVRNHHRYNNDRQGPDGTTRDLSSTFRGAKDGDHMELLRYAFGGALATLWSEARVRAAIWRSWRVAEHENTLLVLASKNPAKRAAELRQVQLDRITAFLGLVVFVLISWEWTLMAYLPAFFVALTLVNVQNYYEHFGARPEDRHADSVSHYGKLYNLLTFYDGYHQEHHLRPGAHWTRMPAVRREHAGVLDEVERVISPVPAIVGVLHRDRARLHLRPMIRVGDSPRGREATPEPGGTALRE